MISMMFLCLPRTLDNLPYGLGGNGTSGQLGTIILQPKTLQSPHLPEEPLGNCCCGSINTAAIKTDGTLWVWGRNKHFWATWN
jgi:alpha-tubulin suppressor-like RCC1 family protein